MRWTLLIIASIWLAGSLQAQPTKDWDTPFPGSGIDRSVYGMDVDSQDRINLQLERYTSATNSYEAEVVQYSATGTQNWSEILTATGATEIYPGYCATDASDNIWATFEGYDGVSTTTHYLVLLNSSGQEQWRKTGVDLTDGAMAFDGSGNLILVSGGSVRSFSPTNGSVNWTFQATGATHGGVAIDSLGNIHVGGSMMGTTDQDVGIWVLNPSTGTEIRSSSLQDSGADDSAEFVMVTPSGGTAVVGLSDGVNPPEVATWVFDSSANYVNGDVVGTAGNDWHGVDAVAMAPSGEFIAVGYVEYSSDYSYIAYAFNANGTLNWSDVGASNGSEDDFSGVAYHQTEGFLAVGGYDFGGTTPTGRIRSYNVSTGSVNWTEDLPLTGDDPWWDEIGVLSTGDIIVAGATYNGGGSPGAGHIARYDVPPPPNQDPVLTLSSGPVSYTEDGSPTALDNSATVTDSDSADFDTGTLTVSISANGESTDVLSLNDQGTGAGQIGVAGNTITYGGTSIGTFTGGTGGTDLVITFNASSTPTAAEALVQNLLFSVTSDTPSTSDRTVDVTITDGDGGTSSTESVTVQVTANDDPPVFSTTPPTSAVVGQLYSYTPAATDPEGVGSVTITGNTIPSWLTFSGGVLSGTPAAGDVGNHSVSLTADDTAQTTDQNFTINVVASNSPPSFTSTAVTAATEGQLYTYNITTTDADTAQTLTITGPTLPSWLTLTDNGDGTATLEGTPTSGDVGANAVVLNVSDGIANVDQSFSVQVAAASGGGGDDDDGGDDDESCSTGSGSSQFLSVLVLSLLAMLMARVWSSRGTERTGERS